MDILAPHEIRAVTGKNLTQTAGRAGVTAEKRFAHIGELADQIASAILRETGEGELISSILTFDGAERIYREGLAPLGEPVKLSEINRSEEGFFNRQLTRADRLYLCRRLAQKGRTYDLAHLIPLLFGAPSQLPTGDDLKVAFLRNRQASRAFEHFAKYLGGVAAVYEDNFRDACESVHSGRATYAIIPIHSTTDGRLNGFFRQMEQYDLNTVLSCEIDSDDGENTTTYVLAYRERLYIPTGGMPLYECKITFSDLREIADLADAASYFGATLESVESLPILFSGRANAFNMVFGLKNAELSGLFTYLALEYPQTAAVGIYDRTE